MPTGMRAHPFRGRRRCAAGGRRKYLLFMTHFRDADIPRVWHRLTEVHRTSTLQDLLETPLWHRFAKTEAFVNFMHAHSPHRHESQ
jgi:hypothetical protein